MPDKVKKNSQTSIERIVIPASKEGFLFASSISLVIFLLLLLGMKFSLWLPNLDAMLSKAVQGIRSDINHDVVDARRWWLMLHLAAVFFAARLAVPLLKLSFERDRPSSGEGLLQSFSFPSGHANTSMMLFGVIALIVIRNLPSNRARWVLLVSGISMAHWPSDVIAGIALGVPFVLAFGWQLQQHPLPASWFTPAVLCLTILISLSYLISAFTVETARYLS